MAANSWEEAIKDLISQANADPGNINEDGSLPVIPEEAPIEVVDEDSADELAPPESVAAPSSLPTAPSSAAPGTPAGHLFERPALQQALTRARGQPLAMELKQMALERGQPADFAAELRATMEKSALERGIKRRSLSDAESFERPVTGSRPSVAAAEPLRRLSSEPGGPESKDESIVGPGWHRGRRRRPRGGP